ncbi:EAL domain-containing protein [Aquincola tertiaricarbonis]|uniref:EAL domain-containing protein n=1 Tax=Aquincola tertiaricarbonis TaxID=391953 RepID=A0ABY4SH27_AQUTE|nr:EAL domain-containing protein [Aquincola tertiaricarbonis]URI11088.1 EAL domain-containing protein [Aquincola tertiaricarbonis]
MREGMLWLTPYLAVLSALLVLAQLSRLATGQPGLTSLLDHGAAVLQHAMPLMVWGALGAVRALQARLPRAAVALLCMACGALCEHLLALRGTGARAWLTPMGLLLPLWIVPWMGWLAQRRWLARWAGGDEDVVDALRLIVPGLLVVAGVVGALGLLLAALDPLLAQAALPPIAAPAAAASGWLAMALTVGHSLLALLGLPASEALAPLLQAFPLASSGQGPVNQSFFTVFVFIGGSGATAGLLLAVGGSGRLRQHRVLALASLAPVLVNANELLLFGLPVILNPRLLLPFCLAPLCNLLLAWSATRLGWVPALGVDVPASAPIGLNALLAGGGHLAPLLLQGLSLLLGAALYAPFVRRWERALQADEAVTHSLLRAVFGQRLDTLAPDAPTVCPREAHEHRASMLERLAALQQQAMSVHYQPQVDPQTGEMVGCEALLRVQDDGGVSQSPSELLALLRRAQLMPDLDLWVLDTVAAQLHYWRLHWPPSLRVAVNISPGTLAQRSAVERMVDITARLGERLVIEITEQAFTGHEDEVIDAIHRLRQAGARIHIDDFGTGYSSLSYLHRFAVDGIKIDKSFTDTLASERGGPVFRGVCSLAHSLQLEVVVEGVENPWQLQQLPPQPGLTVQGWLFARALPPAEFLRVLDRQQRFEVRRQGA